MDIYFLDTNRSTINFAVDWVASEYFVNAKNIFKKIYYNKPYINRSVAQKERQRSRKKKL